MHKILQTPAPTDSTANETVCQTWWSARLPVLLGPGQSVKVHALLCSFRTSTQGCKVTLVSSSVHYHGSLLNEWDLTCRMRVGADIWARRVFHIKGTAQWGFWTKSSSSSAFWITLGTSGIVASLGEKGAVSLKILCLLFYELMQTVKQTWWQNVVQVVCFFPTYHCNRVALPEVSVIHVSFNSPNTCLMQDDSNEPKAEGWCSTRKKMLGNNLNTVLACTKAK